jgi:hypothetical protein
LALSRREHGQDETTKEVGVTQYEQENDLGRGGGEVDDETMDTAWGGRGRAARQHERRRRRSAR